MGGCRCSFKSCTSTSAPGKMIHFFHYPVKSPETCSQWIKNAEKEQFSLLAEDQLKNKVVCEFHFEDRWFTNSQKRRLLKGAVPTLDGPALQPPKTSQPQLASKNAATSKINLVSANEDATLFVLDTSDIGFSNTQNAEKVESYIYHNGSLVPIKDDGDKEYTNLTTSSNLGSSNNIVYEEDGESKGDLHSLLFLEADGTQSQNYSLLYTEKGNEHSGRPSTVDSTSQHKMTTRKRVVPSANHIQEVKTIETKATSSKACNTQIESEFIQKINEHSEEIANIKKLLERCTCINKRPTFNKFSILKAIKRLIPSTLFSVLRVQLIRRPAEEDLAFFISIYEKSPEVYNMLTNECKWNLPDSEIIKELIENQKQ